MNPCTMATKWEGASEVLYPYEKWGRKKVSHAEGGQNKFCGSFSAEA